MRILMTILLLFFLSGCASYFTARPPVIEDRVGLIWNRMVGTLATAPDYRVVYVKLDEKAKLCAEAPADVGTQFAQAFSTSLSTITELNAEASANLAVAMKQLFKRSQGIQFYRDGSFALCNLFLNEAVTKAQYFEELKKLRDAAKELIALEIPHLEKIAIDPIDPIEVPQKN